MPASFVGGCWERRLTGCANPGGTCPAGKTCQMRTVAQCPDAPAPATGGVAAPVLVPPPDDTRPAPACPMCSLPVSICL
jgi:hypothetical protein